VLPPERQEERDRARFPQSSIGLAYPIRFRIAATASSAVDLVHEAVLFEAGDTVDRVYFPHTGIISLVVALSSGEVIEAAMIGRDSILGGAAAMDGLISLNKAIVQLGGKGEALEIGRLREVADTSPAFRTTLIRHEQVLFAQAQQSAACIAAHTVEARLSRWLLRSRDLSGSDTLLLTQEFLAQMLGVQRTSVSPAAHTLQKADLIRYRRGHIEILNLEGLQDAACECYGTVKTQYDRLLNNHL
jgi:CRP-like cAMP-binding protein